jgi:hypothetical protein
MTSPEAIDSGTMVQEFRAYMSANNVNSEKIDAMAKRVMATTELYTANASIASLVLHVDIQVNITASPGGVFNGSAWGVGTPGGGSSPVGYVRTDDLNSMCANTTSFNVVPTGPNIVIGFYDDDGNWTGAYQGVEISTVAGYFSGSGSWSC